MFFKKKKEAPKAFETLELNVVSLNEKMERIAARMYVFKEDECMRDVKELIRIGKNLALIAAASAANDSERVKYQAKFEAHDDLNKFIEQWLNTKPKPKEEDKPRGTLRLANTFRRVNNQAGSAF
jgi:hypothetical protein